MRAWYAFRYWLTVYTRTWRGTIVISVANPVLFLLGIGVGLGHLVDHGHSTTLGGVSYTAFFAPGLLAASAMQTGFIEGGGRVAGAASSLGAYRTAVTTPLEPSEIMAGHLLFITFRVLSSSAVFVAVMALFGVGAGWWVLAALPAALLTGLAFGAPAAAWAVGVRSIRNTQTLYRFVLMPMYLFSGTFFALSQLPSGVRLVASALPLSQGVALCRSLTLGTASASTVAARVGYLLALVVAGIVVARITYRRRLHA
ncbi:MAG: ABC transporter permease [Solirubrobacteraceae bacterium]|jgi:lipooligosaccharide transport system permease protein